MHQKLTRKIKSIIEKIEFKYFSYLLKKYNVEFYFKDELSILSKRDYNDNFEYIFKTKYSCDAIPMMLALDSKIKGCKICFDVGANIGITTIWMARHCEKVYAFEPVENNIIRFRDNLLVNKVTNVELITKAVSDTDNKEEIFYIRESYGHHSLLKGHISKIIQTIHVETITLDTFCTERNINHIDFLKIDVEGAELKVLRGASSLLKDKKIKIIVFEHSPILLLKQGLKKTAVIEMLINYGYNIYRLNHERLDIKEAEKIEQEDLYATL